MMLKVYNKFKHKIGYWRISWITRKIAETLIKKETMTKFWNSEFADKPTNYYNLDMIISVGYRVKSQNGILFRKWATSVLKDYMLKGYAVNQKRLEYLGKTINI